MTKRKPLGKGITLILTRAGWLNAGVLGLRQSRQGVALRPLPGRRDGEEVDAGTERRDAEARWPVGVEGDGDAEPSLGDGEERCEHGARSRARWRARSRLRRRERSAARRGGPWRSPRRA